MPLTREQNLARMRAYGKRRYAADKKRLREHNNARRRQRRKQLRDIAKRCEICERRLTKFNLDHSHETAKRFCTHVPRNGCIRCRRGVLCPRCNTSLGGFEDSPRLVKKALRYLQRWDKILNRRTKP